MKHIFIEHLSSIFFVACLLIAFSFFLSSWGKRPSIPSDPLVVKIASMKSLNPADPLHQTLIKESLNTFYPGKSARNDSLIQSIVEYKRNQILEQLKQSRRETGFSIPRLVRLFGMYLYFLFVFLVVMAFIYYGSQTLGLYLFIRYKQNRKGYLEQWLGDLAKWKNEKNPGLLPFLNSFVPLGKTVVLASFYSVLFAPAYVVAYSFRTHLPTDTIPFLILLGIFTNGILITYSEKFFHLLAGENRKGYVETARVKNLNASYQWGRKNGLPFQSILAFRKQFSNHVLGHIFLNARHQYLSSFKEQASFVISGLIIIEMALNIQGHLGYELLQNILYHNVPVILLIVFGIYLVVKATELVADLWFLRETNRYENQ